MKLIRVTLQGTPCMSLEHITGYDLENNMSIYDVDFGGLLTKQLDDNELAVLYLLRLGVLNVTVEPFTFSEDE